MEENLPEGWVWTTLGEVRFDLAKGIVPNQFPERFFELYSVPNFDVGMPEIVQGKSVGSNKQVVEAGTVLLCKINPRINRSWIVDNFSEYLKIASTEWIPFFKVKNILPEYLCYFFRLKHFKDFVASNASGVGGSLMRINPQTIADYPFSLAPTNEQSHIVSAIEQQFTRLDSAVTSLKSAKARIKQYRASLLKSAVEGELTREWRAEHPVSETGEQLLTRILQERRARWEEEQLRKMREKGLVLKDEKWKEKYEEPQEPDVKNLPELPEGWCWATVEQIITYLRNGLSQKPEVSPPGYRILRINAVRSMRVDLDQIRYLPLSEEEAQDYIIDNGDLLFTRYNGSLDLLGVAGVVKGCSEVTLHPDKLIRVKVLLKEVSPFYVEIACNTGVSREFIESRARTTAGQKGISGSDIKQVFIPLPPLSEQEQIVAEVDARLSNIERMETAIEDNLKRAERERQSILQEAFAGRLVPQDPNDEPASILLERIREERKKREEAEKAHKEERKMVTAHDRKKRKNIAPLYDVLVDAGGELAPEELYQRSENQRKSLPEEDRGEGFYIELDVEVTAGLIREDRPTLDKVSLHALELDNNEQEEQEELAFPLAEMRHARELPELDLDLTMLPEPEMRHAREVPLDLSILPEPEMYEAPEEQEVSPSRIDKQSKGKLRHRTKEDANKPSLWDE